MSLAAQFTDDQIAILGCAIVFGGCLIMMLISQKIGEKVRGSDRQSAAKSLPFPVASEKSTSERRAA